MRGSPCRGGPGAGPTYALRVSSKPDPVVDALSQIAALPAGWSVDTIQPLAVPGLVSQAVAAGLRVVLAACDTFRAQDLG